MKFDYIRIYEESDVRDSLGSKNRIAFVKNGYNSPKIEDNEGHSIIYSNSDNVKLYYPQNYKEFLKLLQQTKTVNGETPVYNIYRGCLLANDYQNKNFCWHQDRSSLVDLLTLAKEYFVDKELSVEKQEQQKSLFESRCKEIISNIKSNEQTR